MKSLFVLGGLFNYGASKLVIQSPQSLKNEFREGVIPASYANFGFIPYGHTIFGAIAFEKEAHNMCGNSDELPGLIKSENGYPTFAIADRGDCSFVEKVRNMEILGAALGIVVDNTDEDIDSLVMSDDGSGAGIRIPSMIISSKDGKKLLDFLERCSEEELAQLTLIAEFDISRPDNRVEYDFWFTQTDDKAMDFLSDFARVDKMFGDSVLMTPRHVVYPC